MMNAEFLIVVVISLLVLMIRAKIKSKYDEKALRRDMNRRYREKHDVNTQTGESRMNMLSLLENFKKGNTIRLFMDDEKQYVVNNAQYKKHDFLRMLSRVEDFKVIYINK